MLKIKFTDNLQQAFWVTENIYSIGRKQDNHLVIDHSSLSPNHACFVHQDGEFNIQDLNSLSGTFVNSEPVSEAQVACGDTIQLGEVKLEVIDPFAEFMQQDAGYWSLIADSGWLSGQEFPLMLKKNLPAIIGRGRKCDLVFPSTHLSRQHAQITLTDEGLFIEDLNSVNGTKINGEKIVKEKLSPGDRIQIDTYSFLLFGPGIDLPKTATKCFDGVVSLVSDKQAPPSQPKYKEKMWKTRSTSPGNREEPTDNKEKPFDWTLEIVFLAMFALALIYVVIG